MKDTKQGKWDRMRAPLYVLKEEKLYYIWFVFVVFFGLLNIWAGLLLMRINEISASLQEGIIYTYSVSICAPLLAEDFVKQIVNKRKGKNPDFVSYHVTTSAVNIIWILILVFLWLGELRGEIWLQIGCGVVSSFFAFYMYCVGQMEQHKVVLKDYDDTEYLDAERQQMDMTKEGARIVDKIEDNEGEIEL
ncbi:MAG: hypothetical protein HFI19_04985 [Lachnospiraceae bacterium]|jgi:hypothetical protein|uniref:hypothetical protein n=1 Tax=Candidatus Merdisoma sp. JLR.KK006 TaxID=3112626 RepID=UPI002FEE66B8|nr:hypothetical protein [Lachnospiraceae bacterium]